MNQNRLLFIQIQHYLQASTITSGKNLLMLYAKQPIENHSKPTPHEKSHLSIKILLLRRMHNLQADREKRVYCNRLQNQILRFSVLHTPCHVCSSNSPANRSVVYPNAKSRIPCHSTSWVRNNYHISGRTWRTHSVGHCAKERWQCKEQTEVLGNQQLVLFHSQLHTLSPGSVLCPFV